jgi:tubulin epsilon
LGRRAPADLPRRFATQARAVLVDMEEGVVGELLRGPLGACTARCTLPPTCADACRDAAGDVFDPAQLISGVSGSGNNWACGAHHYGARARPLRCERARRTRCETFAAARLTAASRA